jgi:hypothetical protein
MMSGYIIQLTNSQTKTLCCDVFAAVGHITSQNGIKLQILALSICASVDDDEF